MNKHRAETVFRARIEKKIWLYAHAKELKIRLPGNQMDHVLSPQSLAFIPFVRLVKQIIENGLFFHFSPETDILYLQCKLVLKLNGIPFLTEVATTICEKRHLDCPLLKGGEETKKHGIKLWWCDILCYSVHCLGCIDSDHVHALRPCIVEYYSRF